MLSETRETLAKAAHALAEEASALGADRRFADWRRRADQIQSDYEALQAALARQGVSDPQAFGRLVQERQHLEAQLKQLDQLQRDRESHEAENQAQWIACPGMHARPSPEHASDSCVGHVVGEQLRPHGSGWVRLRSTEHRAQSA